MSFAFANSTNNLGMILEDKATKAWAGMMPESAEAMIAVPEGYLEHLCSLEETIGYRFHDKLLLLAALDRRSDLEKGLKAPNPNRSMEHLEFVGDRVLNLSITSMLSDIHPTWQPKQLSRAYIRYTRNADESAAHGGPLYRIAKEISLSHYILFAIGEKLDDSYAGCMGKKGLPRENKLCDHMEALFGAIYVDCGKNHSVANEVVCRLYSPLGLDREDHESIHDFGQSVVSPEGSSLISESVAVQQRFIDLAAKGNHILLGKEDRDGLDIDTIERAFWAAVLNSRSNVVAIIVREFPISNEMIEAALKEPLLDSSIRGFLNNYRGQDKGKIEEYATPPEEDLTAPLNIFSSQPSEPEESPEDYFLKLVKAGNDTQLAIDNIEVGPELAAQGFMLSIEYKKPNITPYIIKRYGVAPEIIQEAIDKFPDMPDQVKNFLLKYLRKAATSPAFSATSLSFTASSNPSINSSADAMLTTRSPESIGGFAFEK